MKMHNYYTHLYNKAVFDVLEEKLGKNEAALFARSATAGGNSSRFTGEETARRRMSRWRNPYEAVCRLV